MRWAILALVLASGSVLLRPSPAQCAVCFTGKCYNSSMCFRGCVCMKRGMDVSGYCYSVDAR